MTHAQATMAAYTGPRPDVAALIPATARRVLDVGCAEGALGASLRERGVEVWGIEYDPAFAAEAAKRLDHVEVGDAADAIARMPATPAFDAIVFADVLEHLVDPGEVLQGARHLLSEHGRCIVSLPNVRFFTTFSELGFHGRWPRRDRGVHDRTHLSWFTDRDARDLFEAEGLTVEATATHYRLADEPMRRRNRLARFVAVGPLRPFLAYQYLYRLKKR